MVRIAGAHRKLRRLVGRREESRLISNLQEGCNGSQPVASLSRGRVRVIGGPSTVVGTTRLVVEGRGSDCCGVGDLGHEERQSNGQRLEGWRELEA
ncbi:hypothetical protein CDL15_Pgr011854 [Punica granatum]|nr:hypothetical protein CDL15_Pgr011854 [Punica granatum]